MTPTLLSKMKGSKDTFYHIQKPRAGTTPYPINDPDIAFLAGACDDNLPTQDFKPEDQKSIMEDHSLWSAYQPCSPLISTTKDKGWALHLVEKISDTEGLTLDQHQEKVKLIIVCRLALLPCVAWIAHHSLG